MAPKRLCTKNGLKRLSQWSISLSSPTMVTLVWRGGGVQEGGSSYACRPF